MSKVRVHELAKGLDISSKELINIVTDLGVDIKSHMSILEGKDLEKVIGYFRNNSDYNKNAPKKNDIKKEDNLENKDLEKE